MEMKIRFSAGMTVNLGNYESARVDISAEHGILSDEFDPEKAEELRLKLRKYVVDALGKEVAQLKKRRNNVSA